MADQLAVCLEHALRAAVRKGKQAAELPDHFVGIKSHGPGVVTDEGPRKDAARPPGEVVPLQPRPELRADARHRRDGFERDAAPLTLEPQPQTEGIPFRHGDGPSSARDGPMRKGRLFGGRGRGLSERCSVLTPLLRN